MPASKLKRRRAARVHEPGSGPDKSDQLLRYQRALRELERDGHVSDPGLAARIRAGWHPGVEMAVMTTDPTLPPFIKAACYKTLLDYVEAPKAAQLKLASGDPGDTNIVIQIAPWAAGPGSPSVRALPAPEPVDHEEIARRGMASPPTPPLSDRDRLRAQVHASAETVIVDAPVRPDQPQHVIARVSQARGIVDVKDERRRRESQMAAHHEATSPATTPVTTSTKIF
jgi:hypothetical protein